MSQDLVEPDRFEDLLSRLEVIVERLESSELSLEEAMDAYQEGVKLAQTGHARLTEAERRIEILSRGGQREEADPDRVMDGGAPVND